MFQREKKRAFARITSVQNVFDVLADHNDYNDDDNNDVSDDDVQRRSTREVSRAPTRSEPPLESTREVSWTPVRSEPPLESTREVSWAPTRPKPLWATSCRGGTANPDHDRVTSDVSD